jgi:hypothetical protein
MRVMPDDQSYIVKSRDLAEIIKNPDKNAIEELLESPGAVLAALVTDLFRTGPIAFFGSAVRLTQAAFKGEAFQQLGAEVRLLREKGTLRTDFEGNPQGYQTWGELLTIMDGETPDEERLEALKAMFLAANKVNAADGQSILAYQLFQIAKRLTSNELLVLKTAYQLQERHELPLEPVSQKTWVSHVAKKLGHNLSALVRHAETILVEEQLMEQSVNYHVSRERVTDLGIAFCKNIETYKIELNRAKQKS